MDYQRQESKAVKQLRQVIPKNLRGNLVKEFQGFFADVFENKTVFPDYYIASACDTAGTKMILAQAMSKFDTIGIDVVAMNANDLATLGKVAPFLFMNAISCQNQFQEQGFVAQIMKGIVEGLKQSDCSHIMQIPINMGKGETASVHELVSGIKQGIGVDVAGSMIGFIKKEDCSLTVNAGDAIVALASSGPHSNGFTTLRHSLLDGTFESRTEYKKLYKGKYSLSDDFGGMTVGKWLLTPTMIYNKCIAEMANTFKIVGVNNTGYGLKNLNRIPGKFKFVIKNPISIPEQFKLVQQATKYTEQEMYTTFNMGMGFFVICPKQFASKAIGIAKTHNIKAQVVGSVEPGKGAETLLVFDNKDHFFHGY